MWDWDLIHYQVPIPHDWAASPRVSWKKASAAERRQLVQEEVQKSEEESRHVKAAAIMKQTEWLNWEGEMPKKTH